MNSYYEIYTSILRVLGRRYMFIVAVSYVGVPIEFFCHYKIRHLGINSFLVS